MEELLDWVRVWRGIPEIRRRIIVHKCLGGGLVIGEVARSAKEGDDGGAGGLPASRQLAPFTLLPRSPSFSLTSPNIPTPLESAPKSVILQHYRLRTRSSHGGGVYVLYSARRDSAFASYTNTHGLFREYWLCATLILGACAQVRCAVSLSELTHTTCALSTISACVQCARLKEGTSNLHHT